MITLHSLASRQQDLLRYLLHSEEGLSLEQLSQRLGISRNAVMQHTASLEKLNCIDSYLLPSSGGRPCRAYILSCAGKSLFPKQYALFSTMLLKTISETVQPDELSQLLCTIGKDLAQPFISQVQNSDDGIGEARKIMRELGYETHFPEPSALSNDIVAKNCVFHDLAMENEVVCELDRTLLATLLDSDVTQGECMAKGDASCRFCIHSS